ncbi:MAG TPA: oxalate/formate MFS antiporter, partial [Burkholderiales bacterium]|nr:oxalate/formate MFS antiporter [Burkholderiales bacterium]
ITTETFLATPLGGRLVDRFGPRLSWLAGILIALAWCINSVADELRLFYLAAVISGLGTGLVFSAAYGNALRWFPDRRGLAAGLTAAGFAGGGAMTVVPLASTIQSSGYEAAYLWFGLGQGMVVAASALLLRAPRQAEIAALPPAQLPQRGYDYSPREMLKSPPFWLMYGMFALVGAGGLMTAAQLAPVAADFAIDKASASILGLTLPALSFALLVGLVMNALSRPAFGWLSDHIGREKTMFIAFLVESFALLGLALLAHIPVWFVLFTGLVFFAWGEIFSLFPAACADTYGSKFAAANFGVLNTAKGVASWSVPLANVLNDAMGSWTAVFAVASSLNVLAAMLVFALTPARRRLMAKGPGTAESAVVSPR